jgi:ATP-dependent DNA helicase UvrD/PcrA
MAVARNSSKILPDPQQQQAIEHISGPMLVVAGAGTGKTTVLIQRIARLIREKHARADEIVALTYTDNAANQMRERIEAELGKRDAQGVQIATFHAYCNNLLIAAGRKFGVLDDKQLWVLLRRNLRDLRLNYFVRAANVSKFLDDLLDFTRRCHDELVTPEDYWNYVHRIESGALPIPRVTKSRDAGEISDEEALGRCREIAFVFETVERMLRERNLGTFNHMIVRANDLLSTDAEVLASARKRSRFILVDEFQDANFAQIEILQKLAGTDPNRQNIFAVGDPDQGIYRFRGASSDAFDLFLQRFPATKLVPLTRNRRSTSPILRCAYALISQNPEIASHSGTSYRRSPLISARDEQEQAKRAPVEAILVTSPFMEATDLVSVLLERRRSTRCQWKDIAVLYRSHVHRDELASELGRNHVPFSIEGLDVLDTPEVRDLLACLGAAVSPTDSAPLFRAAALRQFAIDPEALRSAMKGVPRDSTAGIASILPGIPGGATLLETVARARAFASQQRVSTVLEKLISLFQIPRNPAIDALVNFACGWEMSPVTETGTSPEFLEYLDYFREARGIIPLPATEEENTVKLMTAHAAKGLEFEHVFVLRVTSNSFPASYRESLIDFPRELRKSGSFSSCDDKTLSDQEERRLFYVAMTRARDTLSLYGPFGRGKEKTPPGYLRELLKNHDLKGNLKQRTCREFQTAIFAEAEPLPLASRLAEWVALPPASDLASTLSASAIDSYKLCPLRFKLEREWRIPSEVSAALQYGASIHRVLRTYYDSVRYGRPKSDDELIQQFRDDLASEAITDPYQHDLYEQQGITQLREFLATARHSQAEVLHTEEYFSIKIGSTTLVGRIDRMDRAADGGVAIVDYKTGKPKSQEDADDSLQLSLYALAAKEKWGYIPDRLVFHNLDGNTAVGTQRTSIELEKTRCEVEEIAVKIAAGKFDPKPGFHCIFCAYRSLCPKTEKRIPQIAPVLSASTNQ